MTKMGTELETIVQYREQALNQHLDNIEKWLEWMAKMVRHLREGDGTLAEKVWRISNYILWSVENLGLDTLITQISALEAAQAKIRVPEEVQGR